MQEEKRRTSHIKCYRDQRQLSRPVSSCRFQEVACHEDEKCKKRKQTENKIIEAFEFFASVSSILTPVAIVTLPVGFGSSIRVPTEMGNRLGHSFLQSDDMPDVLFLKVFPESDCASQHLVIDAKIKQSDGIDSRCCRNDDRQRYMQDYRVAANRERICGDRARGDRFSVGACWRGSNEEIERST